MKWHESLAETIAVVASPDRLPSHPHLAMLGTGTDLLGGEMKRVVLLMSDEDATQIALMDAVGNGVYITDGYENSVGWNILDITIEDAPEEESS